MTDEFGDAARVGARRRAFVADRRARGAALVVLAVSVALINGSLANTWFPAFTLLDSPTANTIVALGAGVAVALASRFPLWILAAQGAVVFTVAVMPSLAVAALIAGLRRGILPWQSWIVAVLAAISLSTAPWMPPNGRILAPFVVVLPYGVGVLIHAIAEQRRIDQERVILLLGNASLREAQSVLRERQRIADELHDRLGHQLTAMEIQTRLLLEDSANSSAVLRRATIVHDSAARAIVEVQSIVREEPVTSGGEAPVTFAASLSDQLRDMARNLEIALTCTIDPGASELPFDIGYALLRIAQEALTNAAHHAPGQPVMLTLDISESSATLTLSNATSDVGVRGTGRGIRSLANRVALLGGTLSACVDDDSRFVLEASLPLDPAGGEL